MRAIFAISLAHAFLSKNKHTKTIKNKNFIYLLAFATLSNSSFFLIA